MSDKLATLKARNSISFKTLDSGETEVSFIVDKLNYGEKTRVKAALEEAGDLLTVSVSKYRAHRSLDANSYLWVLCQKLAEEISLSGKTKITKDDVYRKYITEVGQFVDIPIKTEAVEDYKRHWESKGDGWILKVLSDSKIKGYKKVRTYFGSSSYDTREMSVLINSIVEDCKEQGIETMPPDELESMMRAWK